MPAMTMLEVPKKLRERIAEEAARHGQSVAALLSDLLDEHQRVARCAAVRRAHEVPDGLWQSESDAWDAALAGGADADRGAPRQVRSGST